MTTAAEKLKLIPQKALESYLLLKLRGK